MASGIFLFLRLSKVMTFFLKRTAVLSIPKVQSCVKKKTRQVIKIPRHRFVEKGVKNALRC